MMRYNKKNLLNKFQKIAPLYIFINLVYFRTPIVTIMMDQKILMLQKCF